MDDLRTLTAETFVPLRGEQFRIAPREAPEFEIELIQVTEAGHQGTARAQFSLLFRGGPTPPLPQSTYRLEHDAIGPLEIFLVPLGPDGTGQRYEAVFT